jgi:K+-sensing histidine kinase KdpD
LKALVGWTFVLLTLLAVGAAAVILTLGRYEQDTASYLVISVQSVLTAERIEGDLHRLERADALPGGGEELSLQDHVSESRRMIQSPAEEQIIDGLERSVATLLARRRERAAGRSDDAQVLRAVQEALGHYEALLDVNLQQAAGAEQRAKERARRASLWGGAAATAMVAMMLALLAWAQLRLVRPLEQLRRSIRQMAQGETGVLASEDAPPELREAAVTLNAMARVIEEQQQGRIEFLGRVGESLAAPLHQIRDTLDQLALRPAALEEHAQRSLSSLLVQTRALERMVGEFLDASRIEEGQLRLQPERFDLREPAREAVELFRGLLASREFELVLPARPVLVYADATRMVQVLNNLLAVALRRSPSGSRLDLELAAEDGEAVLRARVQDGGALGFEDLFKVLHGLDDRLRGVPGAVFGLHACRKLIRAQGGRLEVGPGNAVEIRLPLVAAPDAAATRDDAPSHAIVPQPR